MRTIVLPGLAVLLAASVAHAQPVTSPVSCAVRILRAPDDVRAVVESWVKAEPRCSTALEVRIVPTDGGLYILAEDEHGGTRERVVPDAQSAGVLVASWVADDATYAPRPIPVLVLPPINHHESQSIERDEVPQGVAPRTFLRWISAGLLFNPNDGHDGGARADLDLGGVGAWDIGIAASITNHHLSVQSATAYGDLNARDFNVLLTLGRHASAGRLSLRGAVGVGLADTRVAGMLDPNQLEYNSWMFVDGSGVFPIVEASGNLGFALGRSWALTAGPIATLYSQQFENAAYSPTPYPQAPSQNLLRRQIEVMMVAGLKYAL